MPPAIPLIAAGALVAGGSAAIIGASLGAALVIGALTAALGGLQLLLTPKQTFPALKRTATIREALTTRKLPYGEIVTGGKFSFYAASNGHEFHHMIITLGDAPIDPWDAIDIVWLDGTPIFNEEIDGGGNVISGKFGNIVRIKKHLGGPNQTADTDLIAEISQVDTDFKGVGIAYVYIRLNWNADEFPNGLPGIKVLARTNTYLDTRDSTRRFGTNGTLILREYLTDTVLGLRYTAADFNDTITDASANTCDEIVDTKPVGHAVAAVDVTNNELDLAIAGTGAPLRFETGDRVEIFTDGAAPAGLAVSTSYYAIVERLVGQNYTEDDESTIALDAGDYTGDAATAISAGDVDTNFRDPQESILATVKLATTYADALARTAITITSAGTGQHLIIKTGEPRYTAAGVIDTEQLPKAAIEQILSSMAGHLVWSSGVFSILPAIWRTPITPTYSEADLWGPLVVRTKHGRRDRFNAVNGVLATQVAVGETTDYPSVIDTVAVTNDGGNKIWNPVDWPWTSRISTAIRLSKIVLSRHRREIRVEFPTGPQGFRAVPGSIIQVNNARRDWTNKTFVVVKQADLEVTSDGGDLPLQGVILSLEELDATVFDFVAGSDDVVKAPVAAPLGGNPFNIDAPTNLILSSGDAELFIKGDGTVVSRIKVTWTVTDSFADRTEVQFKPAADSTWLAGGVVQSGQTLIHIFEVEDGINYDVRVRSISNIGVLSDWVQNSHTVVGKTAAPPNVTTFNINRMPDGTRRFTWTATPPADVISGGGFKLKFIVGTGGVWAGMSELHTGLLQTSPYETNELAAGTYTFGLKMIDSSGNESDDAAIIEATLGDPRLRDVLLAQNEFDIGWPGTLVDCFKNFEGILESESSQTWADLPDTWAELEDSWRTILNSKSPIIYTTLTIDLGSDVTVTPLISVDPVADATITMQVGTDADGTPVGLFVPITTVTIRYIKIKVVDAATDPIIRNIVTLLNAETQIEDYNNIDTSAATAGRFERIATGHFKIATRGNTGSISSATIRAIQNAGSGWDVPELVSKETTITGDSEPAVEFKIYKAGVLTDAIVDVEIKGTKK